MRQPDAYLDMATINAIIERAPSPALKIYLLLEKDTGGRISEILQYARVRDIDFEEKEISLRNLKRKNKKIDIKTIPLTKNTIAELSNYIQENALKPDSPIILKDEFTKNRFKVYREVKRIGIMFGKHITPKIFRHSLAIHLVKKGVPLEMVRRILGHTDIRTTAFYQKFSSSDVRKSYKDAMEG